MDKKNVHDHLDNYYTIGQKVGNFIFDGMIRNWHSFIFRITLIIVGIGLFISGLIYYKRKH